MGRMVMSERIASPTRSIQSAEIGPSGFYFMIIQDAYQRIAARHRLVFKKFSAPKLGVLSELLDLPYNQLRRGAPREL